MSNPNNKRRNKIKSKVSNDHILNIHSILVQQKAKERVKVIRNKQKGKKDKDKEEEMDEKKSQLLEAIPRVFNQYYSFFTTKDYEVFFEFPDPDELSIPIIQVNDASFGYTEDKILFRDLNFGIDMDSRIALVGPNGAGIYGYYS